MLFNLRITYFLFALILGFAVIFAVAFNEIATDRATRISDAEQRVQLKAQMYAEATRPTLKRIDELLIDLRDKWHDDWQAFADYVQTRASIRDLTLQLSIIDAHGMLAFSNLTPPENHTDLSDREHFQVHLSAPQADRLFISRPVKGRISAEWSIQFTRPILRHQQFIGVIVASVSPTYFAGMHALLELGEEGASSILRDSGEVMARQPQLEQLLGKVVDWPYAAAAAPERGYFPYVARLDGIERIFGYYKIREYGWVFFTAESLKNILFLHQKVQKTTLQRAASIAFIYLLLLLLLWKSLKSYQQTVAKLRSEALRHRTLLDAVSNAGILIFVIDGNYRLRYMNAPAMAAFGDDRSKLCHQVINQSDTPCSDCKLHEVINDFATIQYAPIRNDERHYETVAQPYVDSDGTLCKLDVMRDVRAEFQTVAQLRESKETLQLFTRDFEAFLDQTTDFIYFKDLHSRIRFCSQTLATITGHHHWREMIGKHDREIFPPDTARIYEEEERPVFSEGRPLLDKVNHYYDADGQRGYVQTNKWPLFDAHGKVSGIFGISRDITARMRTQAALTAAKVAAEAANIAKSRFLA
ncbi:MAG: PAS domain-containing protein, partial [Gammaproteobacteria bacterium]|nr:PAS domain-containing protein [Gammaproteobacteria bacterium]